MEKPDFYYDAVKRLLLKHNIYFSDNKAYEDFIHDLAELFEV